MDYFANPEIIPAATARRIISGSTFAFSSIENGNQFTVAAAAKMHQNASSDRGVFTELDHDNAILTKQIKATHCQDRSCDFDVESLFKFVVDILLRANSGTPGVPDGTTQAQLDALDAEGFQNGVIDKLKLFGNPIHKISSEISCKCSGGLDAHTTTMVLLNTLSSYSWDAKAVIALASFAVSYGEFGLVAQLYAKDPLAKFVALFKQLPCIERADSLELSTLIMAMQNVTKCILKFKGLSSQSTAPGTRALMLAAYDHMIPTAVYLTIKGIVTCATRIMNVIGVGHRPTAEASVQELFRLEEDMEAIQGQLKGQLKFFYKRIAKEKINEAYESIVHVFETAYNDNMKILEALIRAEGGQLPIFNCSTKKPVKIASLRTKYVLLLISDLDSSHEELSILKQMYNKKSTEAKYEYEVVWFPVDEGSVEWDDKQREKFEREKDSVRWHLVSGPLHPAVIKYMKEVWHYNSKPQLVVLDPSGKVVNPDAIHMIRIWQNAGFPFTSEAEVLLWQNVTWTFELLVEGINDKKRICFYGGTDITWIREFTDKAIEVARKAGFELEMLYVGKSKARETVLTKNAQIVKKHGGLPLSKENRNRFWVTLEGMWHSKMRHVKSVRDDAIIEEITTLLNFDASDQGWAVICEESGGMAKAKGMAIAKGDAILSCLKNFDAWKDDVKRGFVVALNQYLGLHRDTTHHCNRLIVAGTSGITAQSVMCADCHDPMEKFIMYRCCKDHADDSKRAN